MIYKFRIVSDEVDNFRREICIDSDATFLDLHDAILDSVGFTKDQMTSFFICDDDWEKKTEITLVDMGKDSDEDTWIMSSTRLSDLIEDEGQRLVFVFDYMTDRMFFMELKEIEPGKDLDAPICTRKGKSPATGHGLRRVGEEECRQQLIGPRRRFLWRRNLRPVGARR